VDIELPPGVNDLSELSRTERQRLVNEAKEKRIEQVKRNLFPSKAWLEKRVMELEDDRSTEESEVNVILLDMNMNRASAQLDHMHMQ